MGIVRSWSVDPETCACYITLSDAPVVSTFEYSDDVRVDLDEHGVAVGIEVLDPEASFPFTDLCSALHIHSRDEDFLAQFLPNLAVSMQMRFSSAPDPVIQESETNSLRRDSSSSTCCAGR